MMKLMQSARKKGPLFLLPLGALLLATSISASGGNDTPMCDGLSCVDASDCGTKCICNIADGFPGTCVDITQINQLRNSKKKGGEKP